MLRGGSQSGPRGASAVHIFSPSLVPSMTAYRSPRTRLGKTVLKSFWLDLIMNVHASPSAACDDECTGVILDESEELDQSVKVANQVLVLYSLLWSMENSTEELKVW